MTLTIAVLMPRNVLDVLEGALLRNEPESDTFVGWGTTNV